MNNKEFMSFIQVLNQHLNTNKTFVKNHRRFADVERAESIAKELFKDSKVYVNEDKLQMGSMIVCVEDYDITLRGQYDIELFKELISRADNFEFYPIGDEKIKLAILFDHVLERKD